MSESFSFNLVDQPWLPCVRLDGTSVTLNIGDVLIQAHQLQSLAGGSPPTTAALHRFLLAILHCVFGPADYDEWANLWEAERFAESEISEYLAAWRDRFDLFAEDRPFYQVEDPRVKIKSTISLSHDRASGNNPTLFDHHREKTGEILTPAEAARTLITAQVFGLAGLSGIKQKFTDGPCAGGIIFMVEGNNLKQTLLLNMHAYPDDGFFPQTGTDIPAWEMNDPFDPKRSHPFGYLDYLTWQNRRVLFQPEIMAGQTIVRKMTMGPALRFAPSLLDSMKLYRPDKKLGLVAISFNENRAFWRDSASLFSFHTDSEGHFRPPATFAWLRELVDQYYLSRDKTYRCVALGMSKKQAKVNFFREERLPFPLLYLTDKEKVEKLDSATDNAETVAYDLLMALRRTGIYLQVADAESKQWRGLNRNAKSAINDWVDHTGAVRFYWASLDIPFQEFIICLAKDRAAALVTWQEAVRDSAIAAFNQATQYAGNNGRSFKATVRGRSYLNYRLNELLPQKEETL